MVPLGLAGTPLLVTAPCGSLASAGVACYAPWALVKLPSVACAAQQARAMYRLCIDLYTALVHP